MKNCFLFQEILISKSQRGIASAKCTGQAQPKAYAK